MPTLLDTPAPLSVAQRRANAVLALPRVMLKRMLQGWTNGLDQVWNPPAPTTPAQVIAALGTNAAEVFQRSAALRTFLESQKAGCTNLPAAARIKPVTINPDGSATLTPAPAAAPAQAPAS